MKILILAIFLFTGISSTAQMLDLCRPENERYQDFCSRMKHLRATINVFDQQREMNLANYPYISILGSSLESNSDVLLKISPVELNTHIEALQGLKEMGAEIQKQARNQNSDVFVLTNQARGKCLSCHESSASGVAVSGWNEVFKMNWSQVNKDCSVPGRNPYLCKSMNGMATSYMHMRTAYASKIESYAETGAVTEEVLRILKDLKVKNFFHFSPTFEEATSASAEEILQLSKIGDHQVFEKAFRLTKSCNQCHTEGPQPLAVK